GGSCPGRHKRRPVRAPGQRNHAGARPGGQGLPDRKRVHLRRFPRTKWTVQYGPTIHSGPGPIDTDHRGRGAMSGPLRVSMTDLADGAADGSLLAPEGTVRDPLIAVDLEGTADAATVERAALRA